MSTARQEQQRKFSQLAENPVPVVNGIHEFHIISGELDDSIQDLEMHAKLLTDEQLQRLNRAITFANGVPEFTVSEIDRQYHLFLKMQEQVASMDGQLRATAGVRDIAAVISSMGGLIGLFLKAQKELDSVKAEANLKEAVLDAVRVLPAENQKIFFDRLATLEQQ